MTLIFLILKYTLLLFSGFIFLAIVFNLLKTLKTNKHNVFKPKYYIKNIPFFLDYKSIYKVRTAGQFLGIIILTAIIFFVTLQNFAPLGVNMQYSSESDKSNISEIGPKKRVQIKQNGNTQVTYTKEDLVYFTTKMPFQFDSATVRVYYKNPNSEQTFSLGFQDQNDWHYYTKPLDVPFLNKLEWRKNGYDPVLYQREPHFKSVEELQTHMPQNALIGTFEYENDLINPPNIQLPDYKPSRQELVIDTPLRGNHVMYAYLNNEPFEMSIQKQDLNWYEDPDPVNIKVYKDQDIVFHATIDDDGITNDSHQVVRPIDISIKNPGSELPENGIYKIIIEANADTIIKNIKTNLHKLVFANSIFPVGNSSVYRDIVSSTSATIVYTNALTLSAQTFHSQGLQNILVGDEVLGVNTLNSSSYLPPKDNIAKIVIPQNDIILNGFMGYFAFSPDQFFLPMKYHILPISKPEDVTLVDYILTDYLPSHQEGEWQVNEQTFDLRTAYIKDNKLSWIIKAPKLKERGGNIIIKDIQITFHKKGWL